MRVWIQMLAFCGLVVSLLSAAANAANLYSFTDLGELPGGPDYSVAMDINDAGQVVGFSRALTGYRAFLWSPGSGMQNLGDLPGGSNYSYGHAINNHGHVVGYSAAASGDQGFIWTPDGGMQAIPGTNDFTPHDIKDNGQIVGYGPGPLGTFKAYIWTSGSGLQDLGDLPGGQVSSIAYKMNDHGQVVGYSRAATGDRAFLWSSSTGMLNLGDLPGGMDRSGALNLNNSGHVVGFGSIEVIVNDIPTNATRAILWTSDHGLQDLGVLPGGLLNSVAYGINDFGLVVGRSSVGSDDHHAFLWTASEGMQDLNALIDSSGNGWTLTDARAINNSGQIVGWAQANGSSRIHAFLLTPVPEPGSIVLAAMGFVGLIVWTCRKRRFAKVF